MKVQNLVGSFCVAASALSILPAAQAEINIQTVYVGNAGNAADTVGYGTFYGSVDHTYSIGKYEVTLVQYTAFLNAVAKTDPNHLYNEGMANDVRVAGISRSGESGSYTYSVIGNGQRPVTYVSWFDAARFTNWLTNGQKTGAQDATTTEDGAYTLNGATSGVNFTKNALAQWYLPSENEWYKAAYYDPNKNEGLGGYWRFATQSDIAPGNVVGSAPNQANYLLNGLWSVTQTDWETTDWQNFLTAAGSFTNSKGVYGTYDQNGNVWEWVDETIFDVDRIASGGAYDSMDPYYLQAPDLSNLDPAAESADVGFRVAEAVPEPSTYLLMGLGGVLCAALRRKSSKR